MTCILLPHTVTLHRKTCKEQQSSERDEGTEQRFVKRDANCQSEYEVWYFLVGQALLAVSRCRSLMTSLHYLRAHTRGRERCERTRARERGSERARKGGREGEQGQLHAVLVIMPLSISPRGVFGAEQFVLPVARGVMTADGFIAVWTERQGGQKR